LRLYAAIAALLAALTIAAAADAPVRPLSAEASVPLVIPVAQESKPPDPVRIVDPGGIGDAMHWARRRAGTVGFAVAEGKRIRGVNLDHQFYSASVVKAMLALAVVRRAPNRDLTSSETGLLRPMVTYSDNDAASATYAMVGSEPLYRIAKAVKMRNFSIGGNWADALLTARDQALLFQRIDRLAPKRHRKYLRGLLAGIVPAQRWGIAPVAEERGFEIMFKGGWRTGIFHQVALLERDGKRISLAVLTSGTDHAYGRETQSGIASRVLAKRPRKR
jgi:Beta-lactamase enzyme family